MINYSECCFLKKNGICELNQVLCNPDDESMNCEYSERGVIKENSSLGERLEDLTLEDMLLSVEEERLKEENEEREEKQNA